MTKLTSQLNVKVCHETERKISALAAIEDKAPSEYVRDVILKHLQEVQRQYERMQEAFGPVTTSNPSNTNDPAGRPGA